MAKLFFMDLETGELLTEKQAHEKFVNEYDGDDPTNALDINEYFETWVDDGNGLRRINL